jgi:hypothetical protein
MANLKCPICQNEYTTNDKICPNIQCGFTIGDYMVASGMGGTKAKEMLEAAQKRWNERSSSHTPEMPASQRSNLSPYPPLTTSNPLGEIQQILERYRESHSDILGRLHKLEETEKERGELQEQINRLSNQQVQLKTQLQQAQQERSQLISKISNLEYQLQQAKNERSQLKAELQQQLNDSNNRYNESFKEINTYISHFYTQIEQIEQYLRANQRRNSPPRSSPSPQCEDINNTQSINNTGETPSSAADLGWAEFEILKLYNDAPKDVSSLGIEVSETEESINNRRSGNSQPPVFANKRRGNYWILNQQGVDYLVPSKSFKINEYNYNTIKNLFECRKYQPGYSQEFQLLEPAKVSAIGGERWELIKPGVIEF